MTKSELIELLAARHGHLAPPDTTAAVSSILEAISRALADGHRIEIWGFGSFEINTRAPRIGRNPRTGATVPVPSKRVPHFKAGKKLRERVDSRK